MRNPFRRRPKYFITAEVRLEGVSPLDADVIRPGDPGWAIYEAAMKSGKPVRAVYNNETGEVVSIEEIG